MGHIGRKAEPSEGKEQQKQRSSFLLTEAEENGKCHLRDSQWWIKAQAGLESAGDADTAVICRRQSERDGDSYPITPCRIK